MSDTQTIDATEVKQPVVEGSAAVDQMGAVSAASSGEIHLMRVAGVPDVGMSTAVPVDSQYAEKIKDQMHETQKIFDDLRKAWSEETAFVSDNNEKLFNENYLGIVGLGPAALPLIVADLDSHGSDWHLALRLITRNKEIAADASMTSQDVIEAWRGWAASHGIG